MKTTIYNVYVPITSQEQADRMKQLCIDNGLPIWEDIIGFEYWESEGNNFFYYNSEEFSIGVFKDNFVINKEILTEKQFIDLTKNQ